VLNSLAQALDLSAEVLLDQAGLLRDIRDRDQTAGQSTESVVAASSIESGTGRRASSSLAPSSTEAAIRADNRLSGDQKRALLAVYRSYIGEPPSGG
jgi:hypothetical protein